VTSCCTLFAAQYYPVGLAPEASRFFTFVLILFVVHSFVSVPPCLSLSFSCPGFSVAGVTDDSRQDCAVREKRSSRVQRPCRQPHVRVPITFDGTECLGEK